MTNSRTSPDPAKSDPVDLLMPFAARLQILFALADASLESTAAAAERHVSAEVALYLEALRGDWRSMVDAMIDARDQLGADIPHEVRLECAYWAHSVETICKDLQEWFQTNAPNVTLPSGDPVRSMLNCLQIAAMGLGVIAGAQAVEQEAVAREERRRRMLEFEASLAAPEPDHPLWFRELRDELAEGLGASGVEPEVVPQPAGD